MFSLCNVHLTDSDNLNHLYFISFYQEDWIGIAVINLICNSFWKILTSVLPTLSVACYEWVIVEFSAMPLITHSITWFY